MRIYARPTKPKSRLINLELAVNMPDSAYVDRYTIFKTFSHIPKNKNAPARGRNCPNLKTTSQNTFFKNKSRISTEQKRPREMT